MQLKFGQRNIIKFKNEQDFYLCLGYLSNPNRFCFNNIESYDNKYGDEYRIWLRNIKNIPNTLEHVISDGGYYAARLNCNEYIQYIMNNYGFPFINENLIPNEYKCYFHEGRAL